ncbi:hypothetical protein [Noviherbaspirillum sp. UKPF54]|uniref:hypothetical protein n=1 Tax=Noviherbaspirillum sp. UKPF54 TaxID=2601898 RepID=UPI0011B0FCA1|nr:hypothetical protein [Noviherbaspirillum sp. UKPF54]QDZ29437.1 hypothetical protein FAY22_16610 [Noviherbaspirillum sp. UKPF54]
MKNRQALARWVLAALRRAGWAPAGLFGFYLIASLVFNAYPLYWWLDSATHFSGGAALSYFLLDLFDSADDVIGHIPRPIRMTLVFSCVGLAAICWEFYEFLSDYFFGTTMQWGLADTMSDLFFGLLGSAAFLVQQRLRGVFSRFGKRADASKREAR